MEDKFRNETAIGSVEVLVVDLDEEAVMQSGSFRVAGYTSHQVLQQGEVSSLRYSVFVMNLYFMEFDEVNTFRLLALSVIAS